VDTSGDWHTTGYFWVCYYGIEANNQARLMKTDKETRLSIRMSQEELESLKVFAASKNATLADWVRETLLFQVGVRDDRIAELERRLASLETRMNQAA